MSGPACVVFDPTLTDYDFGVGHPMSPIRVDLTVLLSRELGVLSDGAGGPGLATVDAPMADDDLVATVSVAAVFGGLPATASARAGPPP